MTTEELNLFYWLSITAMFLNAANIYIDHKLKKKAWLIYSCIALVMSILALAIFTYLRG